MVAARKTKCKAPGCSRRPWGKHRGLCKPCYLAIKDEMGWGYLPEPLHPARQPTHHEPGSPAKVEVMRQRAARREEIFHPGDATCMETLSSPWE